MIDAAIPLSVRPVEFNGDRLVNALQQGQQRRDQVQLHRQQMEINQQRIQEGDIGLQKARQAERDARISQQAFAETPDGNLKKWLKRGTELGWSAEGRMGAEQHANAIFTNELTRQKTGDEITASRNDRSREILAQADHIEAKSPEEYQRAYPAMYDAMSANDPEFAQHFDKNTPPTAAERNAMKFHYAAKGWTEKEVKAQTDAAEEARKAAKDKHDVTMRPLLESEAQSKASNEQRQADAVMLAAAAKGGPDAFLPVMQQIARGPNGAERIKPFGAATTKWTPEDFARAGATPGQLLTAENAAGNITPTELYMKANGNDPAKALSAMQRDHIKRALAASESPSQRRLAANDTYIRTVQEYASKFLNEAGGDVTKAVTGLQKYVEQNAGFSRENRKAIQQSLHALRDSGANDFFRALPPPSTGTAAPPPVSSPAPSTGATGNAPKVQGPPPPAKSSKVLVKTGDGKTRSFESDELAKAFESLVASHGGHSERVK